MKLSIFSWTASRAMIVLLISLLFTQHAMAADRYWVGGTDDRWESTANWSSLPRGAGGAAVPTASDIAILSFSGGTIRIRSNVRVDGLLLSSVWTGSLLQGTGTIVAGDSGIRIGSGYFVGGANALSMSGSYTQTGGIVSGIQGTMTLSGSFVLTDGANDETPSFSSTGTIVFDGTSDQNFTKGSSTSIALKNLTLNNSGGGSSDDIITNINGGLNLSGALTITSGHLDLATNTTTLVTEGNVTLADDSEATLSGGTMYLGGNVTVNPSASFYQTGATVTLNGTSQTLSGSMTLYSLTKSVSASESLHFHAGSTVTVNTLLTLAGASDQTLALESTTPGTQWYLNPLSGRSISYVYVLDSNNVNTTAISCSNCFDGGNNTNWSFSNGITVSSSTSGTTEGSQGNGGSRGSGSNDTFTRTVSMQANTPASQADDSPADDTPVWSDLQPNHPYAAAALQLHELGIVQGNDDGTVRLDRSLSRIEAIALLMRTLHESDADVGRLPFRDVETNAWYAGPLRAAYAHGFVRGFPDGSVRPNDTLNAAQSLKFISIGLGLASQDEEATARQWFEPYVAIGRREGLIQNSTNLDRSISRGEFFSWLVRLANNQ